MITYGTMSGWSTTGGFNYVNQILVNCINRNPEAFSSLKSLKCYLQKK